MKPDAELRMRIYQEGQRAFNARTLCPYNDWRAGTWEKGRIAAEAFERTLQIEPNDKFEDLATEEEIKVARDSYGSDEVQIDDGAAASRTDEGIWVQAWVWVPN